MSRHPPPRRGMLASRRRHRTGRASGPPPSLHRAAHPPYVGAARSAASGPHRRPGGGSGEPRRPTRPAGGTDPGLAGPVTESPERRGAGNRPRPLPGRPRVRIARPEPATRTQDTGRPPKEEAITDPPSPGAALGNAGPAAGTGTGNPFSNETPLLIVNTHQQHIANQNIHHACNVHILLHCVYLPPPQTLAVLDTGFCHPTHEPTAATARDFIQNIFPRCYHLVLTIFL